MTDDAPPPDDTPGVAFERGRVDDALYVPFNPGPMQLERGADGLPVIRTPTALPIVPPLQLDTLVCMADKSEYVIRDAFGRIEARFSPEVVERRPNGRYYVPFGVAARAFYKGPSLFPLESNGRAYLRELTFSVPFENDGRQFHYVSDVCDRGRDDPAVTELDGVRHIDVIACVERGFGAVVTEVEPIRPQCKFLVRQMVDIQDASDHQMTERLCTARRDAESFFLSVANAQVFACEFRDPRDVKSEEYLDRFDAAKVKLGKERVAAGEGVDLEAALKRTEDEANRGLRLGGIFKES